MTYPNGRAIDYNYGSSLTNLVSQIACLSDSSGTVRSYGYQGTDKPSYIGR